MKIYRVANSSNVDDGFYRLLGRLYGSCGETYRAFSNLNAHQPCPNVPELEPELNHCWRDLSGDHSSWYFGFHSKALLQRWVSPRFPEQKKLVDEVINNTEFSVYQFDCNQSDVFKGNFQCVFRMHKGSITGQTYLKDFLK